MSLNTFVYDGRREGSNIMMHRKELMSLDRDYSTCWKATVSNFDFNVVALHIFFKRSFGKCVNK